MTRTPYALTFSGVAVLLAACSGSQPPIGAPGAMPQSYAFATHAGRGESWMLPKAKDGDLLYVSTDKEASIVSYPQGKTLGVLSPKGFLGYICPDDKRGYVYFLDGSHIRKYARGGLSPIATTTTPLGSNDGCAVDPTTDDLAVTHAGGAGIKSDVYLYHHGTGHPRIYTDPTMKGYDYCGYDPDGNLLVDGIGYSGNYLLAELPEGSLTFTNISLNNNPGIGLIQWDGAYITIEMARAAAKRFIAQRQRSTAG